MKEKTKYRITFWAGAIFIIVGLIFDLFTLIPFVGDFIGWLFWLGGGYYLYKTGHGLANWKTAVPELISFVAEFIPAVQELPTIFIATIIIVVVSRFEDKTGVSLMPKMSKKIAGATPPRLKPTPVNSEPGVRQPNNVIELQQPQQEDIDIAA
jgi:hypothetical protein